MIEANPLLRFPEYIQTEVENLRLDKQNALMIAKIIESKYVHQLQEEGLRCPTFNDIKKYLKWAKAHRGVPTKDAGAGVGDNVAAVLADMDEEAQQQAESGLDTPPAEPAKPAQPAVLSAEDAALITEIDLTTPKSTLEDVKKRLQLTIYRLEKLRVLSPDTYNDKLEVNLKNYYIELAHLTHTEVKMAEELRDSDKIDVSTVKFILNKLFQCVSQAINDTDPVKSELFFSVLTTAIKRTKNEYLEQCLKGETGD